MFIYIYRLCRLFKNRSYVFLFSKMNATSGTNTHAGGCFTVCKSFDAKVTLDCYFPVIIKLHGPEGAGLHTFPAADTQIVVNQHDPLIIPENGIHRTCIFTGGFCAVVAIDGDKGGDFFNYSD